MSIVNFSIPLTLDKRISKVIKEKGFASKAEFFRSITMQYLDVVESSTTHNSYQKLDHLTDEISKLIVQRFKGKNLPSAEQQLDDM
jgi:hypothetical protein